MKIGILGVGTVGSGVVNVLAKNRHLIKHRAKSDMEIIIAAVADKSKARACDIDEQLLTEDAFEVVNHPEVEVVLELIGGITLAKDLIERALENGKHVITANKALIASYGNVLLQLAKENQLALLFEAAVGGGIPIIKAITQGLSANKITALVGIINGTSNFILSEMTAKQRDFADVLQEAQDLGYAEADPTYDIEGIDAAHKLAILSALSFAYPFAFNQVLTEGISQIKSADIAFADELGYVIKHLGIAKYIQGSIEMRVQPTLIPKKILLAQVNGVMNAILIQANALGQSLYYGAGAGDEATASAIIADLVDLSNQTYQQINFNAVDAVYYISESEIQSCYYLRLCVDDTPGVLAEIAQILSRHNISMESVIQHPENKKAHIAIITNLISNQALQLALTEIESHRFNQMKISHIAVEELT